MDSDWLMDRTKKRPIPAGMIQPDHARLFGVVLTLAGAGLLYFNVNPITCVVTLITTLLYIFIYTPLKKLTWLNTSIGAVPGSIHPLGVGCCKRIIRSRGMDIVCHLFLWQHPHFYAIALMYKDDYAKANLKMLPVVEPDGKELIDKLFGALLLVPFFGIHEQSELYFYGALFLGFSYLISGFLLKISA